MTIFKITFLIFFFCCVSFAGDTTAVVDLNFDGNDDAIKMSFDPSAMQFTLTINGKQVKANFVDGYDASIKVMDINRNDNLREVVVYGWGNSDQHECFFYQYIDNSIVPCGHLAGNLGFESKGNGMLTENAWMGFYEVKFDYKFDSRAKTLTFVEKEFYDVNQQAEVKSSFKLLASNIDNSAVVTTLKPGTKITLVKADITPTCTTNTGYIEDMMCDWFLIKTADGVTGWCRLNDFHEKVDGLIWAG